MRSGRHIIVGVFSMPLCCICPVSDPFDLYESYDPIVIRTPYVVPQRTAWFPRMPLFDWGRRTQTVHHLGTHRIHAPVVTPNNPGVRLGRGCHGVRTVAPVVCQNPMQRAVQAPQFGGRTPVIVGRR